MVRVNESQGIITVAGSYDEVSPLTPQLKRLGFRWDPGQRVWYATATPKIQKALETLFPPPAARDPQQAVALLKDWYSAIPASVRPKVGQRFDGGLTITMTLPSVLTRAFQAAGGKVTSSLAILDPKELDVGKLPHVLKAIEQELLDQRAQFERTLQVAKQNEQSIREIIKRAKLPDHVMLVDLEGYARLRTPEGYRDQIKALFPQAVWQANNWTIPYTTQRAFEDLIDLLQGIPAPVYTPRSRQPVVNRRPGVCLHCHKPVGVGEGLAIEYFDGDSRYGPNTDEMVWGVVHHDCYRLMSGS